MEKSRSEFIIDTYANHVVGTAVGFCSVGGLLVVVAVETAEITGIEAHLLVDVPGTAEAHRIAVAGKRGVLLVAVAQAVVGTLTAAADGELVVDVVFHTGKNLMRAVRQFLLAVVGHLRILVVEEMIFQRST